MVVVVLNSFDIVFLTCINFLVSSFISFSFLFFSLAVCAVVTFLGLGRFQLLAAFVGSVAGRWTWSAPSGNRTPGPGPTRQSKSELRHFILSARKPGKLKPTFFSPAPFLFHFFFSTAGPSYVVGSSFVSSIRIHEPHPDECWGFLLPPSSSCFVFILTLTYSPSSSSIVVGYCLDRFLLFFLAEGHFLFVWGCDGHHV